MPTTPAARWLARAVSAAAGHFRPAGPGLAVYAFGKHPAFADFVDVARLPPVPPPLRHFHDHLRPTVERDGGPAEPTLIAWHDGRGTSAVVLAHPSRDRGDAVTGGARRCPLLLGVSARSPLVPLLSFAADRLSALAEAAMVADADGVLARIAAAAADWPAAFDGNAPAPRDGPGGRAIAALRSADGPAVVVAIGVAASVTTAYPPTADTLATQLRSLPERPQF